jgi:cleavage stimulation factor subunit 2
VPLLLLLVVTRQDRTRVPFPLLLCDLERTLLLHTHELPHSPTLALSITLRCIFFSNPQSLRSMAPNDKAGRVVFIGNIPYGGTEELIIETLGRVGQVNNFRLVYDKETGRPKGFGFAEFADADAAASAVRNLNDHEIMGRKLRVDWSNDNGAGDNAPSNHTQTPSLGVNTLQPMNGQPPQPPQAQQSSALGPLPPGAELPPNLTCPDAISRTLSTLPPDQLLDILSQMKGLVMTDPAKATELLRQAPQLAYAIFQSLLLLQLVDPQILGSLVETATAPPAAQPPPMQQPPPVARPPVNYPAYPPQAPTPQPQAHMPQPYAQPPPVQQQPPAQAAAMDQQAMYAQVMALTPDQINQLPPEHRAQILQIRQFLMAGGRP